MAFVVRSSREFTFNAQQQSSDIGPGEYDNTTTANTNNTNTNKYKASYHKTRKCFTNHSTPLIIPFNSTSERNCTHICKDNFPGPGSYNQLLGDDSEHNSNCNCSSNNGIKHINKYASHKHIGFLTNAKRFDNDTHDGTAVPGPGQYEATSSFSTTSPCGNNNNKRCFFITKSKVHDSTNKPTRIESIPKKEKENIGYYLTNGEPVLLARTLDTSSDTKFSGAKGDCVGPGRYNVTSPWEKHVVKWKCGLKVNKSLTQKNFELFQSRRENVKSKAFLSNSCDHNVNTRLSKTRKVIFKQIQLRRKEYIDNLTDASNNVLTELKYNDVPGPGFYERDDTQRKVNYFEHKSHIQRFGSVSPKFHSHSTNTSIGPGSYFKQPNTNNNHITNTNTAYIQQCFLHKTKTNVNSLQSEIPILLENIRNKHKPSNIGPGSYNVTQPLIRKEISNITQFGSVAERFNQQTHNDQQTPAPGAYDPDHSGQNKLTFQRQGIEKARTVITSKDKDKFIQCKNDTPPVGSYNPGVVTSIQYAVSSKLNPHKSKLSPFNGSDTRFPNNALSLNSSGFGCGDSKIGPGEYDVPSEFDVRKKSKGFRFGKAKRSEKKRELDFVRNKEMPGPGEYNTSLPYNWNKKSFNILFI